MNTNETLTIDNLQIKNLKIKNSTKMTLNISEKIGDLCFDIVKFLLTAFIISSIFLEISNKKLLIICAIAVCSLFALIGIWFYKRNK